MPISRHERHEDRYAGPKFRRAILVFFGIAAIIGLVLGLIWVAAGLWHFHGVR